MLEVLYDQEYVMKLVRRDARREGFEEGYKEGYKIGFEEGYKEGLAIRYAQEVARTKKEIAVTAFEMGFSVDTISKITGLPEQELKELEATLEASNMR